MEQPVIETVRNMPELKSYNSMALALAMLIVADIHKKTSKGGKVEDK